MISPMMTRATIFSNLLVMLLCLGADLLFLADALFDEAVRAPGDEIVKAMPYYTEAKNPQPSHNPYLSDWAFQIYPWQKLVRESYRSGRFPLWNEHSGIGQPLIGNLQCEIFSPYQPLNLLTGDQYTDWKQLCQLLLAQACCLLLARVLGLSACAAFILAIGYSFGSYMQVWAVHPVSGTAAFCPMILAGFLAIRMRFRWSTCFATALAIALSVFAGHIESTFMACMAACGVGLLGQQQSDGIINSLLGRLRYTLVALLTGGLGILLAACQVLPFFDYLDQSPLLIIRNLQPAESVPAIHLLTLLDPRVLGFTTDPGGFRGFDYFQNFMTTAMHMGAPVLFFSIFGILSGWLRRRKWTTPLFLITLFGIAFSHAPEAWHQQIDFFPFNVMPLVRMHFLASLLLPVLAAIGVDLMLRFAIERAKSTACLAMTTSILLALPLPLCIGILGAGASHDVEFSWRWPVEFIALGLVFALALLFVKASRRRLAVFSLLAIVSFLTLVEAFALWQNFVPITKLENLKPQSAALSWLEENDDELRTLPLVPVLPPQLSDLHDIQSLRTYDSMGMTRLTGLLFKTKSYQGVTTHSPIVTPRATHLDMMSVGWTLTHFNPERAVNKYVERFLTAEASSEWEFQTNAAAEIAMVIYQPDNLAIHPGAFEVGYAHETLGSMNFVLGKPAPGRLNPAIGKFIEQPDLPIRDYLQRAVRFQNNPHHYIGFKCAATDQTLKGQVRVAAGSPPLIVIVLVRNGLQSKTVFQNKKIHVGKRASVLPRAYISPPLQKASDLDDAADKVLKLAFNPRANSIVETEEIPTDLDHPDNLVALPWHRIASDEIEIDFNRPGERLCRLHRMLRPRLAGRDRWCRG